MDKKWYSRLRIIAPFAALLLSACGGSSSSSSSDDTPPPIDTPEGLTGAAGNAEVELEWNLVEDADGYNLYWTPADGSIDLDNPDSGDAGWAQDAQSPHTVDSLENRSDWTFVVTATRNGHESDPSDSVTAHPAPGISGYSIESDDFVIAPGEYNVLSAFCGQQRVPVGGGMRVTNVSTDTHPEVHIQESWPRQIDFGGGNIQNVWSIRALNETTRDREVTAYAVCIDPPEEFEVVSETVTLDAGATSSESIDCPDGNGLVALGAGIDHSSTGSPDVRISGSQRHFSNDGRWEFQLGNDSTETREATLHVMCALPPRGYRRMGSGGPSVDAESYDEDDTTGCDWPSSTYGDKNVVILGAAHHNGGSLRLEQSYPATTSGAVVDWETGVFNTATSDVHWRRRSVCAEQDL